MKNNSRTWIGGAIASFAVIFSIFVATSTTAQAQYCDDRNDREDRTTTATLLRRHSVRDSYVAMIRAIGSMPATGTAATGTAAMETVATEIAAEREAFLEISLADLKSAIDKVISNLKCCALQARHFFVLELRFRICNRSQRHDTGSPGPAAW